MDDDNDQNLVSLNIPDKQLVYELTMVICEIIDAVPKSSSNIILPALADVVATCCECEDDKNPEAHLNTLYNRALDQFHAVWTKRDTPKPDSVTPFTKPENKDKPED